MPANLRLDPWPVKLARMGRALAARPGDASTLVRWMGRLAARGAPGLWRPTTSGSRVKAITYVMHRFMDADDVATAWDLLARGQEATDPAIRATQERLQACAYGMAHPERDKIVPACVQHSVLDRAAADADARAEGFAALDCSPIPGTGTKLGRMRSRRAAATAAGVAVLLAACDGGQAPDTVSSPTPTPTIQEDRDASVQRVPDVEVETFDGTTVSLADHADVPMVVNFWASWCPPCVAEMPDLEDVHQTTEGQIAFVGVNTQDSPNAAARLVEETGVSYDLVRDPDGALFRAFEVFGMPSTFYVEADGVIVGRHTGLLTGDDLLADLIEHFGIEAGRPS